MHNGILSPFRTLTSGIFSCHLRQILCTSMTIPVLYDPQPPFPSTSTISQTLNISALCFLHPFSGCIQFAHRRTYTVAAAQSNHPDAHAKTKTRHQNRARSNAHVHPNALCYGKMLFVLEGTKFKL